MDLYVGDSLGVGTAPHVKIPEDVRGGRPSREGAAIVRAKGRGAKRIVFDLGTNDGSAQELARSLRQVIKAAPQAQIYAFTINGPKAGAKNAVLRRFAKTGKINLVSGEVELAGDGIHATGKGYAERARRLQRALRTLPAGDIEQTTEAPTQDKLLPPPRPSADSAPVAEPAALPNYGVAARNRILRRL